MSEGDGGQHGPRLAALDLRESLLRLERPEPEREAKFREEIRVMMERRLNSWDKARLGAMTALGVASMAFFVDRYLDLPEQAPVVARLTMAVGVASGMAWAALGMVTLVVGRMHRYRQRNVVQGLQAAFVTTTLGLVLLAGLTGKGPTASLAAMAASVGLLTLAGTKALVNLRVSEAEESLREHLLRVELRLAEMAERPRGGQG